MMGLLRRHREPELDEEDPADTANAVLAAELRAMAQRLNELADGMAEVHGIEEAEGDNGRYGNHP